MLLMTACFFVNKAAMVTTYTGPTPGFQLQSAPSIRFPGGSFPEINLFNLSDCNSPCWWKNDTLFMLNSAADPWRSFGPDIAHLGPSVRVKYTSAAAGYRWIESIQQEPDGTLYGWYHFEPGNAVPNSGLTAPRIGAARSKDNGLTWDDLGILIVSPNDQLDLQSKNHYFAGGAGDFSVILDRQGEYFYFVYDSYYKDPARQGVCMARVKYTDRDNPVLKIQVWYNGGWNATGRDGNVTPVIPVTSSWHCDTPDAFWGPSIHYNTFLHQYVILLNRANDPKWGQEGIYISFNNDLSNPTGWSVPKKVVSGGGWYPQVVGTDKAAKETDRLAGRSPRFFVSGASDKVITFTAPVVSVKFHDLKAVKKPVKIKISFKPVIIDKYNRNITLNGDVIVR